ncbi:MAG: carbohydrate kinase [Proteobacteria bacterium]|nr:carbohydrate kinase [Pseudomonadota bacterium]
MLLICGDAFIDFMPIELMPGLVSGSLPSYRPAPAGSCCTLAIGLGRLGARVGFMGGLSTDFFGQFLAAAMEEAGVSLHYAARLPRGSTLGFFKRAEAQADYAFYDRETAMRSWTRAASPPVAGEVQLLHAGSHALIGEPAASDHAALFRAEKGQRLLSLDPNCRPALVDDVPAYHDRVRSMLALADIIKLSVADLDYLMPGLTPDSAARGWLQKGARLVVVTQGKEGVAGYTRDGRLRVPAQRVEVADTVGAGDSLMAALLWQLETAGRLTLAGLDDLSLPELEVALGVAVAAAAITCGRRGADLPWRHELAAFRNA